MAIIFELQRILMMRGPRRSHGEVGPRYEEIDAVVGVGTNMAYHPAPLDTVLHSRFPDAWMVTSLSKGTCVTTFPTPADAETCRLLIAHLHEQGACQSWEMQQRIEQFATSEGRWFFPPESENK